MLVVTRAIMELKLVHQLACHPCHAYSAASGDLLPAHVEQVAADSLLCLADGKSPPTVDNLARRLHLRRWVVPFHGQ